MLLNYIENSKLDLFILSKILFFLDFENTIFFELFFNFENSTFFDFINFNKFFETTKLLDIFENLLFLNLDLTLQKYSKFQLY